MLLLFNCQNIFKDKRMKFAAAKKLSTYNFRRLVGVQRSTFDLMVEALKQLWKAKRRRGGPSQLLSLENQILLTLSYWRNYGTYFETGAKFGVSESSAFVYCRWVEDNLIKQKIFHLPGKKNSSSEDKQLK